MVNDPIKKSASDLPGRVNRWLPDILSSNRDQVVLAVKTAYRVNDDMPYSWLILTCTTIAVCSSHRRGLHWKMPLSEINTARLVGKSIHLMPDDPTEGDFLIPFENLSNETLELLTKELTIAIDAHVD